MNDVWSSNLSKGQIWVNPFTGKSVMMLTLCFDTGKTAYWYTRDVAKQVTY